MRGSVKRRYEGSWSLILDLGYQLDRKTGLRKRKQKWVTFRGTKKDAQKKLTDLLGAANKGEFVERSKITMAEWLTNGSRRPLSRQLSGRHLQHVQARDRRQADSSDGDHPRYRSSKLPT